MAREVGSELGWVRVIWPRKGAMRGKWATSVRKRPISTSGFSPGWMTAEELEDHLLVEEDAGVGLLGGGQTREGSGSVPRTSLKMVEA